MPPRHPYLKNSLLAAVLAFLVPGLGHLYQGRTFKGLLYAVCILGTFFFGLQIGDGKVVYFSWAGEHKTWYYLCQVWTGVPALPAIYQSRLRPAADLRAAPDAGLLEGELTGELVENLAGDAPSVLGTVTGKFTMQVDNAANGGPWTGSLIGVFRETGSNTEFPLAGEIRVIHIEPRVHPFAERRLSGNFRGEADGRDPKLVSCSIRASLPRPLIDRYCAPLQDRKFEGRTDPGREGATDLDWVNYQLGARFELGVLYTVIAGLLNVLAIYDALDGPADEYPEDDDSNSPAAPPPPPPGAK